MDNSMVKRGIGAIVLAIIAALLLGYLLKDKSRERQEVVDMKLPGAPEINIPSLSEATEKITDGAASLVGEATDTVADAGNAVVASASGTMGKAADAVSETANKAASSANNNGTVKPGFSFRPPNPDEQKEIVDNVNSGTQNNTPTETPTTPAQNTNNVVASSQPKKAFKPRIEEEPKPRKKVKKPVAKKPVAAKPSAPEKQPKKASPVVNSKPASGKYSIQLLATSSQSRANKLASTMNSEGYVAFITQTTSNNKILYRVRVGGHNDRDSAIKSQECMKRRYTKNFFVQNSLVVSN